MHRYAKRNYRCTGFSWILLACQIWLDHPHTCSLKQKLIIHTGCSRSVSELTTKNKWYGPCWFPFRITPPKDRMEQMWSQTSGRVVVVGATKLGGCSRNNVNAMLINMAKISILFSCFFIYSSPQYKETLLTWVLSYPLALLFSILEL